MKWFLFCVAATAAAATLCSFAAAATSEELDDDAVIDLRDFECDEEPQRPLDDAMERMPTSSSSGAASRTTAGRRAATGKKKCWHCGPVVERRVRALRRKIDATGSRAVADPSLFKYGLEVRRPDPVLGLKVGCNPALEAFYEREIMFWLPELIPGVVAPRATQGSLKLRCQKTR
jgi:hypothetical protein